MKRHCLFVIAIAVNCLFVRPAAGQSTTPEIFNFSPAQGTVGTSVAIEGAHLTNAVSVQFNGREASFTVLATIITAIVPTNATTGPITVRTPAASVTTTNVFTVTALAPPSITAFTPLEGEAGTTVAIAGANLTGVTSVRFNGVEATFSLLAGDLFATVPIAATTGPISVTTAGGTAMSSAGFTVTRRAAPIVTGFSPASGPPGTSIEIAGTNLVNVTAVQFNGINASFLSFGTSLRATVPLTAKSGPITVVTATGTATSSGSFTVTSGPPPVIAEFTPTSGEPGDAVEIRGSFLRDAISVKFNGVEAAFTNSLFRPLTVVVPTNAATGPITVTTSAGTATSAVAFVITNLRAPQITQLSVLSGQAGELIQIYGTNLTQVVGVEFNGVTARFLEFTAERLFAFAPAGAASGPIKVMTAFGTAASADSFTVLGSTPIELPLLSIRSLSPREIEIAWQVAAGVRLEAAESLTEPIRWSASAVQAVEAQGRSVVVIKLGAKSGFYRLQRP